MSDRDSESSTNEVTELFQKMKINLDSKKFKWSGTLVELKSFIGNLLCTDCENKTNAKAGFKCTPLSLTITLNNKTVLFEGEDAENIKQLILSHFDKEAHHQYLGCCPVYESEYKHIIRRVDEEPILGYEYQFCAAFFHTHEWGFGNTKREHQCLDERRCIISKRALDEGFKVQPKTVVAVVKFQNKKEVVYEAKYTNCVSAQQHAEDFFKDDVEKGELKTKIDETSKGTITMYLTLQPCNESTSAEGTTGTRPNHSCCNTLKNIFETLKKNRKNISLRIKVTHPNHLSTSKEKKHNHEELRKHAVEGIKDLMNSGIEVSAMDREDWGYLFSMTIKEQKPRDELDHDIRNVLQKIADTDKKTLLR